MVLLSFMSQINQSRGDKIRLNEYIATEITNFVSKNIRNSVIKIVIYLLRNGIDLLQLFFTFFRNPILFCVSHKKN